MSVELRGVSVSYEGREVLHELTLSVPSGAWVCLIGPNGAGKSTALRAIGGGVAHQGSISLDGEAVGSLPRREVAKRVAFVPQTPAIPPGLTVLDYALMGRTPYVGYFGVESEEDVRVVAGVLEQLDLSELAGRELESLSGGELQRVVLSRALCQQAPVLLLDEPTSALDVGHQQQVLELVESLRRSASLTVVSAMHDLTQAGQFADELLLLSGGRAVAAGTARAVLTEGTIREHYGASVRVIDDPDGGVIVIPTRSGARAGDRAAL